MTDTDRLDAIGKHGLCITRYDTLASDGVWKEHWICHYRDRSAVAATLREAIDSAVLDIVTEGQRAH
jgi:hypothetical protein